MKTKKGNYHLWSDSESAIELPDDLYNFKYESVDDAYDDAVDFVHGFDGKDYRVIVHVEDVDNEETIDTIENEINSFI